MVNSLKLKGRIAEAGITQAQLAKQVGISKNSLNAKINGHKIFDLNEAERVCWALGISSNDEKCAIFFASSVPIMG